MTNKSLSRLLPFFDPCELPKFPFIFVCSARRAGKTVLVTDLILNYFHDQYDFIIGLCGNAHTCRGYVETGAIPAKYCHSNYTPDILKEWFGKCDELLKKGKKLPTLKNRKKWSKMALSRDFFFQGKKKNPETQMKIFKFFHEVI